MALLLFLTCKPGALSRATIFLSIPSLLFPFGASRLFGPFAALADDRPRKEPHLIFGPKRKRGVPPESLD